MANKYNFSEKHTDFGFDIITISMDGTALLFGAYYGYSESHIYPAPGAKFTTEIISEIHKELIKRYNCQNWSVVFDRTSPAYEDLQRVFNALGIPENTNR